MKTENKSTDHFKEAIRTKLNEVAAKDRLFAANAKKENKNIDDCIKYILGTVQKTGRCGFTDDEIYGIAMHYYDEDDIDLGGDLKCKVVVNHEIQLTEEEKKAAKQKAVDMEIAAQRSKLRKSSKPSANENKVATQQTFF